MADKNVPGPHPAVAQAEAEQAEREKNAGAPAPPPHPMQAMAEALGTDPHKFDPEAVSEYHAGHPKKAASAQKSAAAPAESDE